MYGKVIIKYTRDEKERSRHFYGTRKYLGAYRRTQWKKGQGKG